jgi:AbrB family looped-hinge helix DNA binding protein
MHVGPQGRVVIPAQLRRLLALQPGETLVGRVEGQRLVLERPQAALSRLQQAFTKAVPNGTSLVDELLKDRREEVAHETRSDHV